MLFIFLLGRGSTVLVVSFVDLPRRGIRDNFAPFRKFPLLTLAVPPRFGGVLARSFERLWFAVSTTG
jgi:hypothetical protein